MKRLLITLAVLSTLALLPKLALANNFIPLRAGPVTMVFDTDNVFLRYLRVGDHEILRGINAPIRNQHWETVSPKISNLRLNQNDDSFEMTFDVTCQHADVDFRWEGSITGSDKGVIEMTFDGVAESTFKKNRIGFCVLHGPSAAGQPWQVETVDGKKSEGHFPKHISAHQPAKNLKAVAHEVAPGLHARVEFEGDIFEMEDQRNWTDASFKTYSTPLERPWPAEIPKGTTISQKLRISVEGNGPQSSASQSDRTVLTVTGKEVTLPLLGVQVSGEVDHLTDKQVKRLKALQLNHLQVDLALSDPTFVKKFRSAVEQAKMLGVSLQVILGLGDSPDFKSLIREIKNLQPPVTYWLVRGGDPSDFQAAQQQLSAVGQGSKMGVTRVTNFVDLNRAQPESDLVQAVGFAINPQIHAFDHASIVESLPMHAEVVENARQFTGDRPLVIGPITMTPQLIDGNDEYGGLLRGGVLPTFVDGRQVEPFTAAWTLGSLKYLADAGVDSATFFETVGWNGLMDIDDVSARPQEFPSKPGSVFPVYNLLKEISSFQGSSALQVDTSDELSAVGLAFQQGDRVHVLVGNLTGEPQTVSLRGISGATFDYQVFGEESKTTTPEISIQLPPYGMARIDRMINE